MISFLLSLFFIYGSESLAMQKGTLTFSNGKKMTVEIAQTPEEKAKGLMYRTSLPKNSGMLFVFPVEQTLSFWMKNTYLPLTIGFFDAQKKLLETQDMHPPLGPAADDQLKHYASAAPALYALEVEQGWFHKNAIKPGITFKLKIHK